MKRCSACGKLYSDLATACSCGAGRLVPETPKEKLQSREPGVDARTLEWSSENAKEPTSVRGSVNAGAFTNAGVSAGNGVPVHTVPTAPVQPTGTSAVVFSYANRGQFAPTPEEEFVISASGYDCGIRKYTGNRSVVVIPSSIRGHRVVSIDPYAFSAFLAPLSNKTIEAVIIPDTVRSIEQHAFSGCSRLSTVIAHPGIEKIGMYAFHSCPKMTMADFGVAPWKPGVAYFPPDLRVIEAFAFSVNGNTGCFTRPPFQEVWLSKKTRLTRDLGFGKTFTKENSAIYYYEEDAIR